MVKKRASNVHVVAENMNNIVAWTASTCVMRLHDKNMVYRRRFRGWSKVSSYLIELLHSWINDVGSDLQVKSDNFFTFPEQKVSLLVDWGERTLFLLNG